MDVGSTLVGCHVHMLGFVGFLIGRRLGPASRLRPVVNSVEF
jgi:hypothetical protein